MKIEQFFTKIMIYLLTKKSDIYIYIYIYILFIHIFYLILKFKKINVLIIY